MNIYKHSFAKLWLKRLDNEIYINGKNFFAAKNLDRRFKITPLKTFIRIGDELLEEKELTDISRLPYKDMKERYNFSVYKRFAGEEGWRRNQKHILYIDKIAPGKFNEVSEYEFKRKGLKIEWTKSEKAVRGVGEGFGTQKGRFGGGDITPWVFYGERRKKKNQDVVNKRIKRRLKTDDFNGFMERRLKKIKGTIKTKDRYSYISELPLMITEDGYLLCLPKTRVLPKILIVGKSGKGKCQPKGSKVLMANGEWKNIEDIKIGDEVMSPQKDGTNIFSKVIDKDNWFSEENYEVKENKYKNKPLYKCSSNHLIPVYHSRWPRNPKNLKSNKRPKELHTIEIENYCADRLSKLKNTKHNNFGISSFPIETFKGIKNCSIEPYTLGVWLGDGCFSDYDKIVINKNYSKHKNSRYFKKKSARHLSICCADLEIIEEVSKYYNISYLNHKNNNKSIDYCFSYSSELSLQLKKYKLNNKKSDTKFIPKKAKLSDIEYRKRLLAGLIDTDGSLEFGGYKITTKSRRLAEDILDIVYSLGCKGRIRKVTKSIKKINFIGEYYLVSFYTHNLDLPIKCERKQRNFKTKAYKHSNSVSLLLKKAKSERVYGITLDSPSQFYITDNWMVTHNSWTLNSILGRVVYVFRDRAGLLNDSLNQFYDLMVKAETKQIKKGLALIGNEPKNLPVVLLYMSCPHLKIKYSQEDVGYRLVIPFKRFLYSWGYFSHGVKKWEIGSPEKYINKEVVAGLNKTKDIKESRDFLFGYFMRKYGKANKKGEVELEGGYKNMIMKWSAALDAIYRDEFTSNLFQDKKKVSPYWTLKTKEGEMKGHPFIISMEAGLVPVVNNYLAKQRPIAKKQMSDLLNKIVTWQMMVGEEKRKRFWIFVDELKDFLGKKNDELYEALNYIFTQGRFNRIGFVGNVQEYTKLSSPMKANSSHLIIFELQTNEERSAIAKDYNLDKEKLEEMSKLKTFQCLITTKEKVVLYDSEGRRVVKNEGGMWKGKIIPPISCHKSP